MPIKYIILRIMGSNFYDLKDTYCELFQVYEEDSVDLITVQNLEYLQVRVKAKHLAVAQLYVLNCGDDTVKKHYEYFAEQKTRLEVNKSAKSFKIKSPSFVNHISPSIWEMPFAEELTESN